MSAVHELELMVTRRSDAAASFARFDIAQQGPDVVEIDGQVLPTWFKTKDGKYWEAERVCGPDEGAGNVCAIDRRVLAPGVLYRQVSSRQIAARGIGLAALVTAVGVTVGTVLVLHFG